MVSIDELKKAAGVKAVDDYVRSGMVVGLGTGSTAKFAIERIGQLLKEGALEDVVGLATSKPTMELAHKVGVPLADINDKGEVDVTIDGADEVAPNLDIVKGRMGGILRKKMIGVASKLYVCIADESKLVDGLGGSKGAVPVEVTQFGHEHVERCIRGLPCLKVVRSEFKKDADGEMFVSPHGNFILYLYFDEPIADPRAASRAMMDVVGVLDHGLFLDLVDVAIIATKTGLTVQHRQ
eukprot:CAMPEP_0177755674 /NCGR_PEP_ID=MMETSP0491_2-20121128/2693_1 /TAXON_ID=63592 /ORGANISM="Tetraselmis chuii, Strain PLY429" /LENGTH=237 /DNA_ID=CAMNT_0019271189 /DNA_START=184 /DNA_END=897 /DNA_ORIENTATION=-